MYIHVCMYVCVHSCCRVSSSSSRHQRIKHRRPQVSVPDGGQQECNGQPIVGSIQQVYPTYVGCAVLGTYSSVWFEELSLLVQSFTGASMSVFAIRESYVYTTSTVVHMCTVRVTVGCKTPATMVYTYICIHILYVLTAIDTYVFMLVAGCL